MVFGREILSFDTLIGNWNNWNWNDSAFITYLMFHIEPLSFGIARASSALLSLNRDLFYKAFVFVSIRQFSADYLELSQKTLIFAIEDCEVRLRLCKEYILCPRLTLKRLMLYILLLQRT